MDYNVWQWLGVILIDILILSAMGYSLYEKFCKRGTRHKDDPDFRPSKGRHSRHNKKKWKDE